MWRCTELAAPSPETRRHLNPLSAFGQRNSFSFRSHWASGSKSTGNYYTSLLEVPDKSPPIHSPHVALTVCKGILCHLQNCGSRDKHLGVAGSIIIWRDIQPTADTQTSCFMSVLQKATPFPQHGICKLECWNGSRKKKIFQHTTLLHMMPGAWERSMQDERLLLKQGYSKLGIWSKCRHLAGFLSKCSNHNWREIFFQMSWYFIWATNLASRFSKQNSLCWEQAWWKNRTCNDSQWKSCKTALNVLSTC